MKRSSLIKLLSLMLCAMMLVSLLAACDGGEGETTEAPAGNETEAPATEATGETPTEAPTQILTEPETTEAPTQVPTEPETTEAPTQAPTEPETTEAPTEPETTEAPTEPETTEAPTEPETTESTTDLETTEATTDPETTGAACETPHEYETDSKDHWKEACPDCDYEGEEKAAHTFDKGKCTVCGYTAQCEGKHAYWQHNADGHYRDACQYCGGGAFELAAHSFGDDGNGVYCCTICKYEPECGGEHWVTDATTHSQPACKHCGFEGDEWAESEHFYITGNNGDYLCDICGFIPECNGIHAWISDEDVHSMEACDKCGAKAIEPTAHTITEVMIENDDASKTYTYLCNDCEYKITEMKVPASVNYFGDLTTMSYYAGNSSTLDRYFYDEEADVVYNHITSASETHVNITGGSGAGAFTADTYEPGRYLVIKYRTYDGRKLRAYVGAPESANRLKLIDMNVSDTWVVSVIDLQDLIDAGTHPTEESPVYIMLLARRELDVAYTALVDSIEEVQELVTDELYAYHGTNFTSDPEIRFTESGEVHTHSISIEDQKSYENEEDGSVTYIATCRGCGYNVARKVVPATVGYYNGGIMTADFLNTKAGAICNSDDNGTEGFAIMTELGMSFARGSAQQLFWCRGYGDRIQGEGNQGDRVLNIGNSKYMVLKVRSNIADRKFTIRFSTEGVNSATAVATGEMSGKDINGDPIVAGSTYSTDTSGTSPAINVLMDGEADTWTTYVIDLSAVMPSHFAKAEGAEDYVIDTLFLTWDENYGEESYAASYIDFATVAFAEDWAAIDAIVTEATVEQITAADGTHLTVNTADGTEYVAPDAQA